MNYEKVRSLLRAFFSHRHKLTSRSVPLAVRLAPVVLERRRRALLVRLRRHLHGDARPGDVRLPQARPLGPLRPPLRRAGHVRPPCLSSFSLADRDRSLTSPFSHARSMDIAMAQKSHFKALKTGTYIKRHTFPQLPFAELDNPKTFKTQAGELLVDGCWAFLRKPSESRTLHSLFLRRRSRQERLDGLKVRSLTDPPSPPRRRLHRRLDPGAHLGRERRHALGHPVLLPAVPLHDAPAPQLARRRQVRAQVRRRLAPVQGARAVLVRPLPLSRSPCTCSCSC